jgi:hypothetical protein
MIDHCLRGEGVEPAAGRQHGLRGRARSEQALGELGQGGGVDAVEPVDVRDVQLGAGHHLHVVGAEELDQSVGHLTRVGGDRQAAGGGAQRVTY